MILVVSDKITYLDLEDYDRIRGFSIFVSDHNYVKTYIDGKDIYLHRYLVNAKPGTIIDHINEDTLDNRKSNLRFITQSGNQQNSSKIRYNNTSGFKNIAWSKQKNKWRVRLKINFKDKHIGFFDDIEDAKLEAVKARAKHMPFSKEAREG
jgi:hypothetical protein